MWTIDPPPNWVGRGEELAVVRAGVEALSRGEGALIWVEGEPGIGKSSLVAEALAAGSAPGWDIGWGIAGKLTERLPLRVMLDCLQVRPGSPDPRRAHAADLLRSLRQGLFADGDASVTGIELLVGLVDELSAAAPAVIPAAAGGDRAARSRGAPAGSHRGRASRQAAAQSDVFLVVTERARARSGARKRSLRGGSWSRAGF